MKKLFNKPGEFVYKYQKLILVGIILLVGVLASRTLFKHNYYFIMHDDLQMMRQLELEKCFRDWQIPCRWVPDMGYGYGFPLFNYYPQLPYLFGEIFRLVSFPFNDVAKLAFALGMIASGFSMYLLVKEFFGKLGGLLSSIFYVWAPYRAVDVYVRGAMNESWAFVWFPLILWGIYKLVKKRDAKYIIILSLSLSALLLTHNLMAMMFIPVAVIWTVGWLIEGRSPKPIVALSASGLLALGLSSFFTLPAVLEQKYVHINSLISDYFQYSGHFATLNQLFVSTFWGDGPSIFGPGDGMAFPVGQIHWILVSIILIFLVVKIFKSKRLSKIDFIIIFAVVVGTGGAFMSHERSSFIWVHIPILRYIQFPWRFLTLSAFGYSFAAGSIFYILREASLLKKTARQLFLFLMLTVMVIIFNWNFFKPVRSGSLTDEEKFSGEAWRIQQQAGIRDYLPVQARFDPTAARGSLAEVVGGSGIVSNESWGTDWAKFTAKITSDKATVRIGIFKFPNWKVTSDAEEIKEYVPDGEKWGRMWIEVPQGEHQISVKLENTPLRTAAKIISLATWLGLGIYLLWPRKMVESKV
jgi:hypothetical protein